MVILVFYFRSYFIVLFQIFSKFGKVTIHGLGSQGSLGSLGSGALWSFHEGVDDVDKKGAVVLRDSRLSEGTFMIYWREKNKQMCPVLLWMHQFECFKNTIKTDKCDLGDYECSNVSALRNHLPFYRIQVFPLSGLWTPASLKLCWCDSGWWW